MSSPVKTITARTTVFDAFTQMIDAGIDHLVVTKEGKVFGVITRKDIQIHLEPPFSIVKLFRKVRKATSLDELKTIFDGLQLSISKIAMTGPNFFDLTRILCSVHDAVVVKVIEILSDGHPRDQFVWIHMGSSGRKEEILATDQDNALVCRGGNLAALADNVNESLTRIGFPKCPGNYMASNSKWNQPLSVWKDYFRQWFADPLPDHIRYLSLFLDMRPVYGETALYDELLASIRPMVTDKAVMLLAQDAIEIKPPLGVLGILGLHKGVDLKTYGIYPIANGARVLALDNGFFGITNTKERLEELSANRTISSEMCHDLIESYGFLQDLRLRHHARAVLNQSQTNNLVTGKELEKIDLVLLKESLKIVSEFRKFLMKKYDVSRTIIFSQL
jgi:CBS domain-containing protein